MKRQLTTTMTMVAVTMSWTALVHGQEAAIKREIEVQRETALDRELTTLQGKKVTASIDDPYGSETGQRSFFPLGGFSPTWGGPRTVYMTEDFAQQKKLASKLVKTDDPTERQAAQAELTKLLNESFDKDVERRKSELEDIKKRLAKMQAVLDKRIANKQKIVDLRIQVLTNDANDLDWSALPSGRSFQTGGFLLPKSK